MIRYHPNGRKLSLIHFDNNFIDGKAFYFNVNGGDSIVQYYERGELIR
jgi:antitoxin component YwqK of YwqJK toxin-antitoxin module